MSLCLFLQTFFYLCWNAMVLKPARSLPILDLPILNLLSPAQANRVDTEKFFAYHAGLRSCASVWSLRS